MFPSPAMYPVPNSIALTEFYDARMDHETAGFTVMVAFVFTHKVWGNSVSKYRRTKDGHWLSWLRVPITTLPLTNPIRERFETKLDRLCLS